MDERAAAQVLFDAGRQALTDQDYDEACAKFEESHRLDPAAGTLLNLGNCEEKRGRPASAWERYRSAIKQLRPGDRRRIFAEEKIAELMPSVPHLTVHLAEDAPPGTQVWRNGTPISGSLEIPLPLNPGPYELVIEAPSHEAKTIELKLELGEQKTIVVRPGETIAVEPAPSTAPARLPAPMTYDDSGISQSTWGYVVGGVGVLSLGAAGVFTLAALELESESRTFCREGSSPDKDRCKSAEEDYYAKADIATIFGVAGGVLTGIGAILVLTDSGSRSAKVEAGSFAGFNGVRVSGSF